MALIIADKVRPEVKGGYSGFINNGDGLSQGKEPGVVYSKSPGIIVDRGTKFIVKHNCRGA